MNIRIQALIQEFEQNGFKLTPTDRCYSLILVNLYVIKASLYPNVLLSPEKFPASQCKKNFKALYNFYLYQQANLQKQETF